MKTVLFLNKFDPSFLEIASGIRAKNEEVCAVLCQDAVYMAVKNDKTAPDFDKVTQAGVKVYLLSKDAQRRGIARSLASSIELVDYEGLVDLLVQENQKVINL